MDYPQWLPVLAVVGAVIAMNGGLLGVFLRLNAKGQGFGPNALHALGTILFIPTLLILAIVTKFETSTLAALLGTIAGYILSNTQDEESGSVKGSKNENKTS